MLRVRHCRLQLVQQTVYNEIYRRMLVGLTVILWLCFSAFVITSRRIPPIIKWVVVCMHNYYYYYYTVPAAAVSRDLKPIFLFIKRQID